MDDCDDYCDLSNCGDRCCGSDYCQSFTHTPVLCFLICLLIYMCCLEYLRTNRKCSMRRLFYREVLPHASEKFPVLCFIVIFIFLFSKLDLAFIFLLFSILYLVLQGLKYRRCFSCFYVK